MIALKLTKSNGTLDEGNNKPHLLSLQNHTYNFTVILQSDNRTIALFNILTL